VPNKMRVYYRLVGVEWHSGARVAPLNDPWPAAALGPWLKKTHQRFDDTGMPLDEPVL